MIPNNILKSHILSAIKDIDSHGVPKGRNSKKFSLIYDHKPYPPKYILTLANKYANGRELDPLKFNGGRETNGFLEKFGFIIQKTNTQLNIQSKKTLKPKTKRKTHKLSHNERCPECKEIIRKLLEKIYGKVETNHRFELRVDPKDLTGYKFSKEITQIFSALQEHRENTEFIKTKKLPPVDYYIPNPNFIIEFDESQHFTECRKVSLNNYPCDLKLGFNLTHWIELCEKINARDNDPPFRDEQRAWYDTLRDFLPACNNMLPTVRLFSKSYQWCNLDPEEEIDILKFRYLIEQDSSKWFIDVRRDKNPLLARVIIAGDWSGDVSTSKELLHHICKCWNGRPRVSCLATPGAFITFELPESVVNLKNNIDPDDFILKEIFAKAEQQCNLLLDAETREKLNEFTNYITIGIDSSKDKISFSDTSIRDPHVELVALVDLKNKRYYWTGKSYPTVGQEKGLIRIKNLSSHFIDLPIGKVLLLGCHDLKTFSSRGKGVTKSLWRKKVRKEFYDKVKTERPIIVLHHPHTTDSSKTWTAEWNELKKIAPSVGNYIGTGRYWHQDAVRSKINDVLSKTKMGGSLDFVVISNNQEIIKS